MADPGCSPINWCFGFPGFSPRPSLPQRSRRVGFASRNSSEYLYLHASLPCGRPKLSPPLHQPLPVPLSWLTFLWTRRTSQLFGSRLSSTVHPFNDIALESDLTSPVSRHQLYPLLDLWLCPHKEKEQNPMDMDHASCGHLPVDAFHCPCVTRLYRTYMLSPANTSATRILN